MKTLALKEVEQAAGESVVAIWREILERDVPHNITMDDRMAYLLNKVAPATSALAAAAGCRQPESVELYLQCLYNIMDDVSEKMGDTDVFMTPKKSGERNASQRLAEERFSSVTAEWDANEHCHLFMGELVCYCN